VGKLEDFNNTCKWFINVSRDAVWSAPIAYDLIEKFCQSTKPSWTILPRPKAAGSQNHLEQTSQDQKLTLEEEERMKKKKKGDELREKMGVERDFVFYDYNNALGMLQGNPMHRVAL